MKLRHAITLITGKLGSGKSYLAVDIALDYIAQNKFVFMNFDLHNDWWNIAYNRYYNTPDKRIRRRIDQLLGKDGGKKINPLMWRRNVYRFDNEEDMFDFDVPGDPKQEDRALLVMDEMALRANSRLYQARMSNFKAKNRSPISDIEFYAHMRKKGISCLVLTQDKKMIDAQLREFAGAEYQVNNLRRTEIPFTGITLSGIDLFIIVKIGAHHGDWQGAQFRKASKSVFRAYNTMEGFHADKRIDDGRIRLMSPPDEIRGRTGKSFEEWEREQRIEAAWSASISGRTPTHQENRRTKPASSKAEGSSRTRSITATAKLHDHPLLPSTQKKKPTLLTWARKAN